MSATLTIDIGVSFLHHQYSPLSLLSVSNSIITTHKFKAPMDFVILVFFINNQPLSQQNEFNVLFDIITHISRYCNTFCTAKRNAYL